MMTRGPRRTPVAPCKFCQKQFRKLEHLQRHERIHTQERPYNCDCGEQFSRRDLLTRHRRQCHSQVGFDTSGGTSEGKSPPALPGDTHHPALQSPNVATPYPQSIETSIEHGDSLSMQRTRDDSAYANSNLDYAVFYGQGDQFGQLEQSDVEFDFLWGESATTYQPLPTSFFDTDLSLAEISQQIAASGAMNRTAAGGTSQGQVPGIATEQGVQFPSMASRLPSLEPGAGSPSSKEPPTEISASYRPLAEQHSVAVCPWRITAEDHEKLSTELAAMGDVAPHSFVFPSRHMLSRFLEGYFRGAHAHLPFIHAISFSPSDAGVELILSLATVGAFHRFEHARGYELYHVAKAVINRQLARLHETTFSNLASATPGYAAFANFNGNHDGGLPHSYVDQPSPIASQGRKGLKLLQGLLVLIDVTSWGDRALVQDALSMASQTAMLVRQFDINITEDMNPTETSWEIWIEREERRRTLFAAYVMFNLQCIAYNIPPMILNSEIRLNLPTAASEWKTPSSEAWVAHRVSETPHPRSFTVVLDQLLAGKPIHHESGISSFGNYVLIHGLFQQIFFARMATSCLERSTDSLRVDFVKRMEGALRNWQDSWEATRESTLDPSSPKGPLGFNATALLRLVYIRLNANTGPNRELITRDPMRIANAFASSKAVLCERSAHLDRAVLQCIHALSVPVRVGIAFVGRTQTLNWSVQHSLCNLECAFLLANWLLALAADVELSGSESLRPDEQKLVNMLTRLIRETEVVEMLDGACNDAVQLRKLAVSTTRLWAETFRGFQVFEIVYTIGAGLSTIADILD